MPRSLHELLSVPNPAWPILQKWIGAAKNTVELLPASRPDCDEALVATQVTTHSMMGAMIHQTGGLLIDHSWLRILGSGHPRLPRRIDRWNEQCKAANDGKQLGYLLVADDAVGGFFALDGGAFAAPNGHVWYFAPDTLRWETLGRGYTDFIGFALNGDLHQYYENLRWPGWQEEVSRIGGDQVIGSYPPPWTKEGKDVARAHRAAVPIGEAFGLNVLHFPKQLDGTSG